MNESIGTIIMRLRKEHGMTQDQLANALGITFQAVSKWENGVSSPDISTLPLLADLFGVSVDQLLGRDALPREEERLTAPVPVEEQFQERQEQEEEAVQAAEPEQTPDAEAEPVYAEPGQDLPWPDDDCFYAVLYHGHSLVGHLAGDQDLLPAKKHFVFSYEGPAQNIFSDFSVEINGSVPGVRGVLGDVKAGGSVDCGDVGGDAHAGTSLTCGDVSGNAKAGTGLQCGDVSGDVFAGAGVECGDVSGNLTARGGVSCSDVDGNLKAGGSVKAGDVAGSVSAGGNVNCEDVGGSVTAGVSVDCEDVGGSMFSGFGRAKAKPWDEESFDRDLDDLIDREIEKAQKAADSASDFGEDLGRKISDAVQRAISFSFGFGKKNKDKEE